MKNKTEFSKLIAGAMILIVFPTVLWLSWRVVELAEMAILLKYTGALPYLTAIITPAWAAFTAILACYFNKAKAENKEKIKNSAPAVRNVDC
jgi:hypothetical protein